MPLGSPLAAALVFGKPLPPADSAGWRWLRDLFPNLTHMSLALTPEGGDFLSCIIIIKQSEVKAGIATEDARFGPGSAVWDAFQQRRTIQSEQASSEPRYDDWQLWKEQSGAVHFVTAPLQTSGSLLGCLTLAGTEPMRASTINNLADLLAECLVRHNSERILQAAMSSLHSAYPSRIVKQLLPNIPKRHTLVSHSSALSLGLPLQPAAEIAEHGSDISNSTAAGPTLPQQQKTCRKPLLSHLNTFQSLLLVAVTALSMRQLWAESEAASLLPWAINTISCAVLLAPHVSTTRSSKEKYIVMIFVAQLLCVLFALGQRLSCMAPLPASVPVCAHVLPSPIILMLLYTCLLQLMKLLRQQPQQKALWLVALANCVYTMYWIAEQLFDASALPLLRTAHMCLLACAAPVLMLPQLAGKSKLPTLKH